jgi:uncharacterized protein YsxB (DUF464 family)
MIKVVVSTNKINILGHADFSTYGKDIVCSSVSSIMTTTINGILRFNKNYISYNLSVSYYFHFDCDNPEIYHIFR